LLSWVARALPVEELCCGGNRITVAVYLLGKMKQSRRPMTSMQKATPKTVLLRSARTIRKSVAEMSSEWEPTDPGPGAKDVAPVDVVSVSMK